MPSARRTRQQGTIGTTTTQRRTRQYFRPHLSSGSACADVPSKPFLAWCGGEGTLSAWQTDSISPLISDVVRACGRSPRIFSVWRTLFNVWTEATKTAETLSRSRPAIPSRGQVAGNGPAGPHGVWANSPSPIRPHGIQTENATADLHQFVPNSEQLIFIIESVARLGSWMSKVN